jgi:valyl-tRNA synthetase
MQLLHPVMPYLTEEVWQHLTETLGERPAQSIMISRWPICDTNMLDDAAESEMDAVQSLIGSIRNIRNEMNVPLGSKADVVVSPSDETVGGAFERNRAYILDLASVSRLTLDSQAVRPPKSAAGISGKSEVFVLLEGLVDFDRERIRLGKEIERRASYIKSIETKLSNEAFVSRAPEDVVAQERKKLEDTREEMEKLTANLEALGA